MCKKEILSSFVIYFSRFSQGVQKLQMHVIVRFEVVIIDVFLIFYIATLIANRPADQTWASQCPADYATHWLLNLPHSFNCFIISFIIPPFCSSTLKLHPIKASIEIDIAKMQLEYKMGTK